MLMLDRPLLAESVSVATCALVSVATRRQFQYLSLEYLNGLVTGSLSGGGVTRFTLTEPLTV